MAVVGTSGSGKTTVGRRLAEALGVPFLELDSIRHQPGWTELPDDEFRARTAEAAVGEAWVIDGNYGVVRDLVMARATDVVWLDLPKWLVMIQVFWRSLHRATTRRPMWNGNTESFAFWLRDDHPIRWAWRTYGERRERYAAAMADSPATWHRLRSRRGVDDLIERATATNA